MINCLRQVFTAADIEEFFKRFGAVLKVEFKSRTKSHIHFADPKDAAKVLQKSSYFYKNHCIRVKACSGFNQPDGVKVIDTLDRVPISGFITVQQNAPILNLNEDCLEHIFKNLHPIDQINFALTCQRFYHVMVMRSKVDYACLKTNMFDDWSIWRGRIFLQIVAPQVKVLYITACTNGTMFEMILSYCRNVEILDLTYYLSYSQCKLFTKLQQLQKMTLKTHTDDIFEYIKNCKNLKSLSINNCGNITGKYIELLDGLEELTLISCTNIKAQHFHEICKNLKKLHYLDVKNCNFQNEHYEYISEYLLELKTLKISDDYENVSYITKSPKFKLQHLDLEIPSPLVSEPLDICLEKFAICQASQLEILKLSYSHISQTTASSLANFKKLKVLHLIDVTIYKQEEIIGIFTKLTELEEFFFSSFVGIAAHLVLQLLEKCLKLKHLRLGTVTELSPDILRRALKLLQDLRARLLRSESVYMDISTYDCSTKDMLAEVNKFPDLLQIDAEYYDNGSRYDSNDDEVPIRNDDYPPYDVGYYDVFSSDDNCYSDSSDSYRGTDSDFYDYNNWRAL